MCPADPGLDVHAEQLFVFFFVCAVVSVSSLFFTVFFFFPSSCLHENSHVVLLYVLEDQAVTLNKLKESFREQLASFSARLLCQSLLETVSHPV